MAKLFAITANNSHKGGHKENFSCETISRIMVFSHHIPLHFILFLGSNPPDGCPPQPRKAALCSERAAELHMPPVVLRGRSWEQWGHGGRADRGDFPALPSPAQRCWSALTGAGSEGTDCCAATWASTARWAPVSDSPAARQGLHFTLRR